jgi:hypothetical protein
MEPHQLPEFILRFGHEARWTGFHPLAVLATEWAEASSKKASRYLAKMERREGFCSAHDFNYKTPATLTP